MRFLKLDVNEKDADDLFRRFEKERTGTIDYSGFLQLLGFDSKLASRRAEKNSDDEELDSLIKRIRSKLEDNLGSEAQSSKRVKEVWDSIMGEALLILFLFKRVLILISFLTITLPSCHYYPILLQVFADIDDDNSGTIDKREMTKALKVLRVDVSSREIDDLFRRFDTDGDGRLGYAEYLEFLGFNKEVSRRSSTMVDRRSDLESLVDRIRLKIEDNLGSEAQSGKRVKEVFADIDDDNSGTIDKREMTKALKVLRVDVSSREIDDLFREYDKDGDGRLGYTEYLQLLGTKCV